MASKNVFRMILIEMSMHSAVASFQVVRGWMAHFLISHPAPKKDKAEKGKVKVSCVRNRSV